MSVIQLKIKIQSLVAEARLIRDEEQRLKKRAQRGRERLAKAKLDGNTERGEQIIARLLNDDGVRVSLHGHRTRDIRHEARSAHLAYGMIRGVPYSAMEPFSITDPNWKRVEELVRKFSPTVRAGDNFMEFAIWARDAKMWTTAADYPFIHERLKAITATERRKRKEADREKWARLKAIGEAFDDAKGVHEEGKGRRIST